jgi:hypothetical protein
MSDFPHAIVKKENGKFILDDPTADGVATAVKHHNNRIALQTCKNMFEINAERVAYFKNRIVELNKSPNDFAIVLLNVDDHHACLLADILMPGYNWQQFRDQGMVPIARGLVDRKWMQEIVSSIRPEAGNKMKFIHTVVVVMDACTVDVFEA